MGDLGYEERLDLRAQLEEQGASIDGYVWVDPDDEEDIFACSLEHLANMGEGEDLMPGAVIGGDKLVPLTPDEQRELEALSSWWTPEGYEEWQRLRQRVLERDGGRCVVCKSADRVQVHHRLWLSEGGTDDISNLVCLCHECHRAAHTAKFAKAGAQSGRGGGDDHHRQD